MLTSASDQELLARQAALQAEAAQVLAQLGLRGLLASLQLLLRSIGAKEPVKVGECPSARLPASEPACDAVVQRVQPGGATSPCVEPCWLSGSVQDPSRPHRPVRGRLHGGSASLRISGGSLEHRSMPRSVPRRLVPLDWSARFADALGGRDAG
jgi:hypothetical protein